MRRVCTEPIISPDLERKAYIMWQNQDADKSKCIGEFIEQINEDNNRQWLFIFYYDILTQYDIDRISFTGIDLNQRKPVFIRSYDEPLYMTLHAPRNDRSDTGRWLKVYGLEYNDKFEYMLRTRAISDFTNCYLGRTPDDFCDLNYKKQHPVFLNQIAPHTEPYNEENFYHKIDKEYNYVN